jgi:hypothetical protein
MSTRILTGQPNIQQSTACSWSRQTGYVEIYNEKFTDYASAQSRGWEKARQGWEFEVTPMEGGCYDLKCTGRYSAAYDPAKGNPPLSAIYDPNMALSDTWELSANSAEKSMFDCTELNASGKVMYGVTPSLIQKIKDANNPNDVPKSADNNADTGSAVGSTVAANCMTLWKLVKNGVESKVIFQPILRHKKIVRPDYTIQTNLNNVGHIFTSAQMNSFEGAPNVVFFAVPASSTVTLANGLSVYVGWLKLYPTVQPVAAGNWEINQEYQFGEWAVDLYTAAS